MAEQFPQWAQGWLSGDTTQISHGLNLVLELKADPSILPRVLWDIVITQDQIKQALEGLSFVHYARFVPSWDGRALMVTTEFDGPLDPYLLDFVIALGDVFDTLLRHVKVAPPLSVREHPEAFVAWVREYNRVPFFRLADGALLRFPGDPDAFDYPVYSAYPALSVTDIAGARRELPRPAPDHPAASVEPAEVQGNILRGYKAGAAAYLFFSISDPAAARRWLAAELPRAGTPWGGVDSALPWANPAPEVLTQVAFTHAGLARLQIPWMAGKIDNFPAAFKEGAAARAAGNGDEGDSAPQRWLFGQPGAALHVVLIVYQNKGAPLAAFTQAVAALTGAASGLTLLHHQPAAAWGGREYFGYRDGLAEPRISGQCPGREPAYQPAASPGEFLLHKNYVSLHGGSSVGDMPAELVSNGSFGVLRLMEQHVDRFERTIADESARLRIQPERLKAKLMGRWPDGQPLSLAPDAPTQAGDSNAFDYAPSWEFPAQFQDHQGLRCPVGAHIRRSNPRTARVAGQAHSRRLLRRGLPSEWTEHGETKKGLMGLFFGASIEHQFEFIQRHWIQGDKAASGIRGSLDPIASVRQTSTEFRFLDLAAGAPPETARALTATVPPLTTTRGCAYLFFPGLPALRALGGNTPPQPPAPPQNALELIGDILKEVFDKARDVVGTVAGSMPLSESLAGLIRDPRFKLLHGGKWEALTSALNFADLGSKELESFIKAFLPPAPSEAPPGIPDQGCIRLADPRFIAEPYALLAQERQAGKRIVWVKEASACWVLDHAGCAELLSRHQDFVQTAPGSLPALRGVATLDPPRHTIVRQEVAKAFTTALARMKQDGTVPGIVAAAIEALQARPHLQHFDFMGSFATPVARAVFWDLMGVRDAEQRQACDALAHRIVQNFGSSARSGARIVAADASVRLAGRLALELGKAWLDPLAGFRDTVIGELAKRMKPGLPGTRPLDFVETLLSLVQIVLAGQSPHYLLGTATLHLLRPDLRPGKGGETPWSQLTRRIGTGGFDTALALALDEARRFEPPLTLIERYAQGPQRICDVDLPAGCVVFAAVGSSNRDPAVFGNAADEFHLDRVPAGHLSLGHGIHHCVGEAVQSLLVPAAMSQMITAMPQLRLANPAAVPAWLDNVHFRMLQALPVARCP